MGEEQDRTTIWLTVIDALVRDGQASHAPTIADVIRLLNNVQFALKRWRWDERSRRGTIASRWLIDTEADVQSLLWIILAPVYGADLVDEHYLPHWGQVQPRVDLGILSLKLIIEVKMLRTPGDFRLIEERVAGDIGLYFKERDRFERMMVVVYDDCDRPQPERYGELVTALTRRDEVADVVIIRRPSMIPDRSQRA